MTLTRQLPAIVLLSTAFVSFDRTAFAQAFLRGDANSDGTVDISDGLFVLTNLFLGTESPSCMDSADVNDNGDVDISDAIATFGFLFLGTGSIQAPGPTDCGVDPTDDPLTCDSFAPCPQEPPVTPLAIPYESEGWRFLQVPWEELQGFEAGPEPDGFSDGSAPFGSNGTFCTLNRGVRTDWSLNTDLLLRRTVNVTPSATMQLDVGVAIDNEVFAWWNGVDISGGRRRGNGCALRDRFIFSVPSELVLPGDNLLAIRAHDFGDLSYVDAQIRQYCVEQVPYESEGWRFLQVSWDELQGFEAGPEPDGFSYGAAPFGSQHTFCELNRYVRTAWSLNTDLLLRRTVNVPTCPTIERLEVVVAIDNAVFVWWNGVDISGGRRRGSGCADRDEFIFSVPTELVVPEDNLLAIRAHDSGDLSYIDARVTVARQQ